MLMNASRPLVDAPAMGVECISLQVPVKETMNIVIIALGTRGDVQRLAYI